jgi:hypothetical protein
MQVLTVLTTGSEVAGTPTSSADQQPLQQQQQQFIQQQQGKEEQELDGPEQLAEVRLHAWLLRVLRALLQAAVTKTLECDAVTVEPAYPVRIMPCLPKFETEAKCPPSDCDPLACTVPACLPAGMVGVGAVQWWQPAGLLQAAEGRL